MNRDCHGTWIPALRSYRCLGDGSFNSAPVLPEICPACKREVRVSKTIKKPKIRLQALVQVNMEMYPKGSIGESGNWCTYLEIAHGIEATSKRIGKKSPRISR